VKRFITNAPLADVFVVFARTAAREQGNRGISAFLVPASTPGVGVGPKDVKMGQAGAWTAEVLLDDVRIPDAALVGGDEGSGFRAAMSALDRGRLHIGALCVGMATRLLDEMTAYAGSARQGGKSIARFQLVQAMLADSFTDLAAGRALVHAAAGAYDADLQRSLHASSAKLFCSEMVGRVADRAVQLHGGTGYMRGVTVERLYRDARLFRIYEGTSEIQRIVIARELMANSS
jgi:acyl-CoA dehydrogenase